MAYKRPEGFEAEALANWELGSDATKNQAERERDDLSWQVPENQWDDGARSARGPQNVGGIGVGARPMLSIPKIKQPMAIVDNQFRSADLDVNIHAISEDADDDTAEVFQDLYRAWITRDSNAKQVRWWAFDRAKQAGRGWYRFNTVYDDSSPDPFDQKVVLERILYQAAVVMDPSAIKPDYSDAGWGFLSAWMPIEVFKRRWPNAKITKNEASEGIDRMKLDDLCSKTPNWVKDGEKKAIQVAEYWKKCYGEPETMTGPNGEKRTKETYTLMWYVLAPGGEDGLDVVEEQEWNGDDIPLIPAIGNELQPFDEERRWEGMVRPSRDGQKLYNFAASTAVEKMASLPKSPWITDIESIEGYEPSWQQSNRVLAPYLPYRSFKDGRPLAAPTRVQDDGSGLQPIMIVLQQADEFIQATTATPDPVLGKRNSKSESGRAIQALQGQSEASNSSYIQNFADITMMYEAKVGIGMIKRVCDRPGRVISALNIQGEGRKVIVNQDFVMENGKPRAIQPPPQIPGQTTTMQPQQPNAKKYDLSKGYYGVSVTIGKSFNTKREQGVELLNAIMERAPELGIVLAPVMLRFMDGPGMKEAAELAKEFRDKQFPGMGAAKDGQETPEQLKSMLQAAKQQIEQMQQAGAEMQKQLEMDQAKAQADVEKVRIKAESDAQNTALKLQAEGQNEQAQAMLEAKLVALKAEADEQLEAFKAEAEMKRQDDQQAFQMALEGLKQRFEAMEAEKDRAQADKMAAHAAQQAEANADREDMRSAQEKEGDE